LQTYEQCLAAFAVLLMLALGVIVGRDANCLPYLRSEHQVAGCFDGRNDIDAYEQPHLHSETIGTNKVSSSSRGISVDSGASAAMTASSRELMKLLGHTDENLYYDI
jgi:hypothetical protein